MGVHFNPKGYNHKVIFMCYSSIRKDLLLKTLKNVITRNPSILDKYQIGLGLLDYGMLSKTDFIQKLHKIGLLKNFHLLVPEELDRDLSLVKEYDVNNVTIYGLGGVNESFIDVIKNMSRKKIT